MPSDILVYHGEDAMEKVRLRDYFKDFPRELMDFVPDFDYFFLNLAEVPVETILGMSGLTISNILLTLKCSRSPEDVLNYFNQMCIFANKGVNRDFAIKLFEATLRYLNNVSNLNDEIMKGLVRKLPSTEVVVGKTIQQQLIEKGEKRGMEKGMEKGVNKGKVEIREIFKVMLQNPYWEDARISENLNVEVEEVALCREIWQGRLS